jgi:GT2 family glycosyltransferase
MTDWIIVPVLNCLDYTRATLEDCLAQDGVDPRVLVVNQGSNDETRAALEDLAMADARALVWTHDPPFPSLAATWNRALAFVWAVGGQAALVVNNDVRLHPRTYHVLRWVAGEADALLVSGVGVSEADYHPDDYRISTDERGGPDFSCFLMTRAGHEQYPFDEAYVPAYCEDVDLHRRMLLGGDGRRIFGVNVPFLHYRSRTLNAMSGEQQAAWARRAKQARAHYVRKWGGEVNQETFFSPFNEPTAQVWTCGPTTPELQALVVKEPAVAGSAPTS